MNMEQIRQAWKQGATKGESPAHKNFPDQMAIKTVIGRALKIKIGSSDDSELLKDNPVSAEVKEEISQNAGKKVLPTVPAKATIKIELELANTEQLIAIDEPKTELTPDF